MSKSAMRSPPSGWSRRRLRFDVRSNPVKSELDLPDETEVSFVPMDAVGELGGLRLDQTRELGDVYNGYTYFADGDVCIAKITPCFENGKGALAEGLVNGVAFGTTELHVLRPSSTLDARFLFYLTIAHDFRSYGESEMLGAGGQKRVPEGFLKDWVPPLPRIETQQRIVRFLDEKTARIDALIEKKQALLERLAEKRQTLITRAVTKGLNPDVPMKPSGVDWLGDIPMHWDIVPLRRMVDLVRGHDLPQQDRVDGDVAIISSAGESGTHDTAACQGPGIVTGRYGTIGRFYLVEGPFWPLNTTLYSRALNCDSAYGLRMLEAMAHLFVLNAMKSAVPGVDRNDLASEYTPRPPRDEQRDISEYLEIGLEGLRQSQSLIVSSIERLSEHRAALITAAVTGQFAELNG